jgi:hypothetical protein
MAGAVFSWLSGSRLVVHDHMLRTFALIDLDTQADAVIAFTRGWTKRELLDWLRYYGDVSIDSRDNEDICIFTSTAGLPTKFRITKDGELVIFADQSARMVAANSYV